MRKGRQRSASRDQKPRSYKQCLLYPCWAPGTPRHCHDNPTVDHERLAPGARPRVPGSTSVELAPLIDSPLGAVRPCLPHDVHAASEPDPVTARTSGLGPCWEQAVCAIFTPGAWVFPSHPHTHIKYIYIYMYIWYPPNNIGSHIFICN